MRVNIDATKEGATKKKTGWSWLDSLGGNIKNAGMNALDMLKDVSQNTAPKPSNTTVNKAPQATAPVVDNRSQLLAQKPGEFKYGQYVPPEEVIAARNAYEQYAAQKPGEFNYSMQDQLNDIINQINNREKFSYDLNGDALYQQYKNQFTQQGKMASMDVMGQAAAMTGGYGNSYAQSVGQQAYQGHLQQLNDKIPELYQLALNKYNMEGQELMDKHNLLTNDRNYQYGLHRDKVNDFNTERDRLYGVARDTEADAYNKWYNAETMRADEHDRAMSEWETDMNRADDEYWNNKSFNYQAEQDRIRNGYTQQELDLAQKKFAASLLPSTDPATVDTDPTRAIYAGNGMDGYSFYFGNDKRTYAQGLNPYTGETNADIENGAFANGYQPDNVSGQKLEKTGVTDVVNGFKQPVYKTPDGKMWIWDEMSNQYLQYED